MTSTAKQKVTPWFKGGKTNPVRPGIYLSTVRKSETYYRRWDGCTWYCGGDSVDEATEQTAAWGPGKGLFWRGLAADPKGKS